MPPTVLAIALAPALVAASTLAARRWSEGVGGIVSAFPAIVGPVLLIGALDHGPAFAARSADGALLGLVALSGFLVAYERAARRVAWPLSVLAGWAAAALLTIAAGSIQDPGLAGGLLLAVGSLVAAHRLMPDEQSAQPPPPAPRWDLPLRMALTAALVVT